MKDEYKKFPTLGESRSATTDLIKTTPESIRKSWGVPPVSSRVTECLPNRSAGECEQSFLGERVEQLGGVEYLSGLQVAYSFPDTIEDEMAPISQAFADKVKAMGGILTPYGLICDPSAPVTGKRYMRLAKVGFCLLFNQSYRHVEDLEFRIRNFAERNKKATDWESLGEDLAKCLRFAFKHRHRPGLRPPVYANKE